MLNAKEGQTYVCVKSDRPWWTVGKEYNVLVTSKGKELLVDDDGARWQINYLKNNHCEFKLNLHAEFKLKETQSKVTMEDLKAKSVERKYTLFEVNKVILRAYNMYDNDTQRLAFLKGYFAK